MIAAVVFGILGVVLFGRPYGFFDMKIYHGAVEWWLNGGELYEFVAPNTRLGFTYPPFAALAMLPMAGMSAIAAGFVNAVASVVALGLVLTMLLVPIADRVAGPGGPRSGWRCRWRWRSSRPGRRSGSARSTCCCSGWSWPTCWRCGGGAAGACRGCAPRRRATVPVSRPGSRPGRRWRGCGTRAPGPGGDRPRDRGQAHTRTVHRLPAGGPAVAGGHGGRRHRGGASLLAWTVAPRESLAYFTSVVWQTDRVGAGRLHPEPVARGDPGPAVRLDRAPALLWFTFAALCCALGLSRAVTAHREGDELAAFTLVGLTSTVISPIAWSHHLVFVVPAVLILMDAALRRHAASRRVSAGPTLAGLRYAAAAVGTYLLFLVSPIWWVFHR